MELSEHSYLKNQRRRIYLATDQMPVFVAVDLLVFLEHAVSGAGAHEVVVALTRCQTAAHCGTGLVAPLTSLKVGINVTGKYMNYKNKPEPVNKCIFILKYHYLLGMGI